MCIAYCILPDMESFAEVTGEDSRCQAILCGISSANHSVYITERRESEGVRGRQGEGREIGRDMGGEVTTIII